MSRRFFFPRPAVYGCPKSARPSFTAAKNRNLQMLLVPLGLIATTLTTIPGILALGLGFGLSDLKTRYFGELGCLLALPALASVICAFGLAFGTSWMVIRAVWIGVQTLYGFGVAATAFLLLSTLFLSPIAVTLVHLPTVLFLLRFEPPVRVLEG